MRSSSDRSDRIPRWLVLYLVLLHLALSALLIFATKVPGVWEHLGRNARPDRFYQRMQVFQAYQAGNIPDGALYFVGDSITQGLATLAVAPCSVNMGIGGDTVDGLARRVETATNIRAARGVVVAIGINDLLHGKAEAFSETYERLLLALPANVPIVASGILPVALTPDLRRQVERANRAIFELCAAHAGCSFLDAGADMKGAAGDLAEVNHIGDGLHLSSVGYRLWIRRLRIALTARGLERGECWGAASL